MYDPEKRLLLKIQKGDRKAFDKLFEEHFLNLCNYAFLMVRDEAVAEEIVAEVFYRFWSRCKGIHIKVSIKQYLLKSVHNTSLNYLKHTTIVKQYKELNIVKHREQEIYSNDYSASPLAIMEYHEMETMVKDAIDHLPEQCKRVFEMNRFKGLKYREIAEELGITISTVKYHMSTSLDILKDKLNGYLGR